MVDPVVAPLFGVAVAFTKVLLRSTNNNLSADIIDDTAGPLAGISQLVLGKKGSKKQVERAIKKDLATRMRDMNERCHREGIDPDRLANPCAEVEAVLDTIGDHKWMLEQAVHDPEALRTDFKERALKQRVQVDERLVPYFDELMKAVVEQYISYAERSPDYLHVAAKQSLKNDKESREADAKILDAVGDVKHMVGKFASSDSKPSRVFFGSRPDVVAEDRFIERGEQEQLNSLIADPTRRRTVLVGMRGCGKTQLAAALAEQCEDANWNLVAWINAVSPDTIQSDLVELAKRLKIDTSDLDDQDQIVRRCLDHLRSAAPADRLIVFDNVEDIDHLTELIPSGDGVRVVATTTKNVGWEDQAWTTIRVGMFDRNESINYLLTVTKSDDHDTADVLAKRLGDLPLALAQAAATAHNGDLSLARYLDRLDSYGSERVIHPIPGDCYTVDVTTALWMAVEEAYEAMKYDIKVRARRQIGALALLAESGIPTQWLDPTIEQRGNREVEDTREAADENAHDALNELIRRNIIQQSADRRTAILHRVEAHAVRSQWDADEEADARDAAVELLFNVDVESLAFTDTDGRLRCTRDLIHQLHSAASQEHSQTIFTDERILTTIDNTLQYAELTGIPAETIKLHSAIDIITQVHGQNNYRVQIARNDLADAYLLSGVHSVANTLYTLNGFGRLLSPKPIFDAEILELVKDAEKCHAEHNHKQAISLYKEAVSKCHSVTGPSDKYIIDIRLSLATAYNEAGMTENAIQQYTKATEEAPIAYGPNHPYTDKLLELLALLHIKTDNYDEAISILNCIHSNRKRIFGNENESTLHTLVTLCDTYMSTNQPKKVISLLEQIDEVRRPKSLHTTVINLLRIRLADAYYANNDFYAAIDSYKSFINHLNEVYADIDADSIEQMFYILDLSEAQTGLAWALYDTQDTEHIRQAIALMQKTARECKLTMGPENWRTINANETLSFFKNEAAKATY